MIKQFKKKPQMVEVLVLIVGHKRPDFLVDTAESFHHYNKNAKTTYRVAFAIDGNHDCANAISDAYGSDVVYCAPTPNGWGRGILRTIAYSLDYFRRNGLRWNHLITIDSDTLIVDRCLDEYVFKIKPDTFFVGQKWGGKGPYSSANPGPTERIQRAVRQFAKLGIVDEYHWRLVDYMVAGPFMLWTGKCLDFMTSVGLLPGPALDELYPYIHFPHDQMTTFILGVEGHGFVDVGGHESGELSPLSWLYCGDVGGMDGWKCGLPSYEIEPYGQIPLFRDGTAVIHPIRSKKFNEGKVRSFFRKLRCADDWTSDEVMKVAWWNCQRLPDTNWD